MALIKGNDLNNNLVGTSNNDSIYGYEGNDGLLGRAGNDYLEGGAGSDTLNGESGIDTLIGGLGNDTYIVNSTTDIITEGDNAGTDTVRSSVSYTLGSNLNNLVLTGTNAINGTGNILNNTIIGNAADNYLDGGEGNDKLFGGLGNDAFFDFYGNNELYGGAGNDYLVGYGDFSKAFGGTGDDYVEGGLELYGENGNDDIYGDDGDDRLYGGDDNDFLMGSYGNDSLNGGTGNDSLEGAGQGSDDTTGAQSTGQGEIDTLTGGTGSDSFNLWYGSGRLGIGPNYDDYVATTAGLDAYALITDFNPDEDVIQLTSFEGTFVDDDRAVNYSLGASPSSLPAGTGLFVNRPNAQSELIAVLQDLSPSQLSLDGPYFSYYS